MKDYARSLYRLSSALFVTFALICGGLGRADAQGVAPTGSFGFLLNATFSDPVDNGGGAILGVMNFDGAGNVAGTYTFQQGGQPAQTLTGAFTGTYSTNPDGSGSIAILLDIGVSFTFATVMTNSGQSLQLVATGSSFNLYASSLPLLGSVQSIGGQIPGAWFEGAGATGSIPVSLTASSQPGTTAFTLSGSSGSGSGTMQCSDGTTGSWTASAPAFTMVFNPDFPYVASNGGGAVSGDVLLAIFGQGCGSAQYQSLSGSVAGNVDAGGGVNLTIQSTGVVLSGIARAAQPGGLSGSFGFQTSASPQPSVINGVLTFDGAGNATESFTNVGTTGNSSTLPVSTGMVTGTYSVNPDGSGLMNFTSSASGQAVNLTIAFVITDGGNGLLLLETSTGHNVRFGTARMQ